MNSSGSAVSCCHSSTWRNQVSASSTSSPLTRSPFVLLVPPVRRDPVLGRPVHLLRADLDLVPASPPGPKTVVCSERYMFDLGVAT